MTLERSIRKSFGHVSGVAVCAALALACGSANAGPLGGGALSSLGRPAGPAVQALGNAVTAVGQGHAGIAPTVYNTAPAAEPFADSVTTALVGVGGGLQLTGGQVASGGLNVTPVAGARTALQTLRSGQLVQAHVGPVGIGNSPNPLISAGALTGAPAQGSLATAGVANANALLNVNAAPQ